MVIQEDKTVLAGKASVDNSGVFTRALVAKVTATDPAQKAVSHDFEQCDHRPHAAFGRWSL